MENSYHEFNIYFSDLNEDAQNRLLEAVGAAAPSDMNWDMDICPIATYAFSDEDLQGDNDPDHTEDKSDEMRTYEFTYTDLTENKQNSVSFCAGTENEAYELFRIFIEEDEHLNFDTDISNVRYEETYDPDDAALYGSNYMTLPF